MRKSLIFTVLFAFVLSFGVLTAFPDHALAATTVAKSDTSKDVKHAGANTGKSPNSVNFAKLTKSAKSLKGTDNIQSAKHYRKSSKRSWWHFW